MIRIALRTLRFHKAGFLASFIAMFLGAAIVMGCGGLLETGVHSAAPPQRLTTAPIVVTGDQRYHGTASDEVFPERVHLDARLAGELAAVPGVAAVAPDVSFRTYVSRGAQAGVPATGHGWSSARLGQYKIDAGAPPSGPGQVAVDTRLAERAGLRLGGRVELAVRGVAEQYEVSGLVNGDGSVFVSDAEAAAAAGRPGMVGAIGVFVAAGADVGQVRKAVAKSVAGRQISVLTGDERGQAEDPGVVSDGDDLVALAAAFGGLSAMVTVFIIAATLGLSVQQRQREMALLRAIGATPGQLRRLILGETMLVAVVATALAWPVGPYVGRWLLDAFAAAGVVPEAIVYRAGGGPLIVGVASALLVALGAAFIAANGAAHTRPAEALAEASMGRRRFSRVRLALAVLFLGGGAALAVGTAGADGPDAAGVATPAAMVWTAGFGLLGPVLARAVTAMLHRPMRAVSRNAGRLATANATARVTRLTSAVLPVMLATGLALALTYMQTTQSSGSDKAFEENRRADLAVTSEFGLPLNLVDTVRAQPGVSAATAQITSLGYIEPEELAGPVVADGDGGESAPDVPAMSLLGVTPEGITRTTAYRAASGSLDALHGDTVALPTRYTGGRRLGDPVAMRLGDGTRVELKLAATVNGRRGYETALLPASVLIGHTDSGLVPQIMVSTRPGTDRAKLAAKLSALAEQYPGLRVADRETLSPARQGQDDTQAWMAYLVLAVVVGYAAIALVNSQVLAAVERRREFSLLRLVGASRGQVMRMMAMEAVLVCAAGVMLGALIAATTLMPLSLSVLGSPIPTGPWWSAAAVLGGALALVLAATLLPTLAMLRHRPGNAVIGTHE
ncbi:FtsX-like permease family protein [Actinomadura litoris]|uniref:FtsX-like permease family protein n=1 Tax=Actinomadura litoris TaxID=2678616 RepID=UPI001FA79286|nr:FtsX-like permease family protein [Actinomadura litoris]